MLALLQHNHDFPGPYSMKAIVRAGDGAVVAAAVAATQGVQVVEVSERESSKGKYLSLRLRLKVSSAEAVLDVYDVLSKLDSVLTTL